ncbi:UDP-glucose 4-epimerase GalE [Dyella terrae]|uniref:UDP-glucose 4-epimerase n=2 Tax=Dyella TaxID=231454 RepID=A0A4R0YL50_9GAMM|nr:UDP-glucose 4-epimerase GalE [Dyella terrae]TCI08178.1 UDP-glucose 4-epimerase GalE [Dyella soli]
MLWGGHFEVRSATFEWAGETSVKVLVCGGAGYIGSHMVRALSRSGHEAVTFDNLVTGHREAVGDSAFILGDLLNTHEIEAAFASHGPFDAVIHLSALSLVGESVADPCRYYLNNVTGTLNLLGTMKAAGVTRLVFSSTAAVFGHPRADLIDEDHPTAPINPYGSSKLMVERILADAAVAYGLRSVSLRYFNAAGASPEGDIGESHQPETHLVPNVLRSAMAGDSRLKVFGADYATRDGTCVRDYVHVDDLAAAHLQSLAFLDKNPGAHAFNLGNGQGFSVLEVIEAAQRVTGKTIARDMVDRRPGDPAVLVASSARARAQLGWSPVYTRIDDIIETAWRWHTQQRY